MRVLGHKNIRFYFICLFVLISVIKDIVIKSYLINNYNITLYI